MNGVRKTVVAGQFYPAEAEEILSFLTRFNRILDESGALEKLKLYDPKAMIVPHAGYIYSGFTANAAYRLVSAKNIRRFLVIGPSHRVYFKGVSIGTYDAYETPLGDLKGDRRLAQTLLDRYGGNFYPQAHEEHSTEVQFPFLKHYFPEASIVEIVYSDADYTELSRIVEAVLEDDETAVVISTDLSHYYDLQKAERLDAVCIAAVDRLDRTILHQGCEACGKIGMEAMIEAARFLRLRPRIVDYRTSADASGHKRQVVGYMSAVFDREIS